LNNKTHAVLRALSDKYVAENNRKQTNKRSTDVTSCDSLGFGTDRIVLIRGDRVAATSTTYTASAVTVNTCVIK